LVLEKVRAKKEERYSRVPLLSDTRYSVKGPRRDGVMQAAKRDCNAPTTCDLSGGRQIKALGALKLA